MLKSIEQIAKEKLAQYTRPLIINGKIVMNGWPVHVAAKKAAAARSLQGGSARAPTEQGRE